jgi:hypothetical protein
MFDAFSATQNVRTSDLTTSKVGPIPRLSSNDIFKSPGGEPDFIVQLENKIVMLRCLARCPSLEEVCLTTLSLVI